ncbi:MAG: hypothetical protein GKC03_09805 [Methanomassiliicoccales archaeon]|nr:hypothetical protein [Methanomassiliicoccales archaeon]NYT16090.1 hypothetical protein [Methanomassiliicoccales archaeon]
MISWADVESRAMRPKVEGQARGHSQIRMEDSDPSGILDRISEAVGRSSWLLSRKRGSKSGSVLSDGHKDDSWAEISR